MFSVERYHDFSAGHRVVGHENKCRFLHGHNYRIYFTCVPSNTVYFTEVGHREEPIVLDEVGRVVDFGVIKARLCQWLEDHWDHKTLLYINDPLATCSFEADNIPYAVEKILEQSTVIVPFNPTAENMAKYLVERVGPEQLEGTGVVLHSVRVEETRKCSATYTKAH